MKPEQLAAMEQPQQERPCTCHPDDNPPSPCPRQYALSECRATAKQPPCKTGSQCTSKCQQCEQPAEGRDWSLLEATQESLREHMAEIKRLRELLEKQPAAPAITYEMAMCFLEVALRNVELVGERGPMRHEIEQAIAAMLTAAPEQKGN